MTEDDLREYFQQFGKITDLVRMTDKATGKLTQLLPTSNSLAPSLIWLE
jgi:RNA recognition motif. (a.k.a. RRM, RBD, or RNP domain)